MHEPSTPVASDSSVPPPASSDAVPAPLAAVSSQPPAIPDYELLCIIGRGSYGDVWLARNVLGELRAVKFIYRDRFSNPRPFEREFDGIQRFEPISRSHPSQLHILHVGKNEAARCFYYVMELADAVDGCFVPGSQPAGNRLQPFARAGEPPNLVRGVDTQVDPLSVQYSPRTLRADLDYRGRLPVSDCIGIGLSLATALAHLHERGLVHRDVKPSNILFVEGVAKLGDIGLVTDIGDTQSIVGTEGYLPPEGPGTPQSDLYSLGKVLYEMSTGLDRRKLPALPADLQAGPDADLWFEFNELVLRSCDKDLARRYQTAEELRADLALLREGKSVRRIQSKRRLWASARRMAAALTVLCGLTALLATWMWPIHRRSAFADGPPSTNELANALTARGLLIIRGDNFAAIPDAYTNFHRAIRLDPNFARPYVGLFELRPWEDVPGLPPASTEEMRGIATKLSELAPGLAATYCARAFMAWSDLDYANARDYAQRAVQADPDYAHGHATHGFMLALWGWPIEARKEIETARGLAPSKAYVHRLLGHTYYVERDFSRAIAAYRETLAWERHHIRAYDCLAMASLAMGDPLAAIAYHEQIPIIRGTHDAESKAWSAELRQAVTEQGVLGYWRKREAKSARDPGTNFYEQAVCQMHLGRTNAALALLDRSYETDERSGGSSTPRVYVLLFDDVWDGLRDHPRFRALLEKAGFTKVMPQRR